MDKPLNILVVDDTPENLNLIMLFCESLGHTAVGAKNGYEAIELYRATSPDMILMDVMMPVMDGYLATIEIKKIAGEKWVPVIFISAKAHDDEIIKGINAGGDDYLAKPVNMPILEAKINSMHRIIKLQQENLKKSDQLARYRAENEYEQEISKSLMERMIRANKANDQIIERLVIPAAAHFSGDIVATEFTPNNSLHVILADSAGHGLSAALCVLPVVEVFYGMTKKGYSLSTIVRELNNKIKNLMPADRFVAATLAAINFTDRTIEIWNGGMPNTYFVDDQGAIKKQWRAEHPPMGIMGNTEFQSKTELFQWDEPGRLFLYSDGLIEAENENGEQFGSNRVLQALGEASEDGQFWYLLAALNKYMNWDEAADDISLAAIHCTMTAVNEQAMEPVTPAAAIHASESKMAIKLGQSEIKSFDVLPWLITWLEQVNLNPKQCQDLFLIISELYNNALDHGILGLNSSLKHQPDGFGRYLDMRDSRLDALKQGSIEINLELIYENLQPILKLRIRDSGAGFAATAQLNAPISTSVLPAGRGIFLVKSLCAELNYLGNGNEVVALYALK